MAYEMRRRTPMPNMEVERQSSGSSPVVTYRMSAEELEQYFNRNEEIYMSNKYPQLTKEFMLSEFAAGKSASQIEREQGMPKATIAYQMKKLGVKSPVPRPDQKKVENCHCSGDDYRDAAEQKQGMTLDRYQSLASRTANTDWDVIAVRMMRNPKLLPLLNFALGASGESGEIADEIKKVIFHGNELDADKLVKEIGDALWYLSQLAQTLGYTLDTVAERNIDKLKSRYPEGFSEQASQERDAQ